MHVAPPFVRVLISLLITVTVAGMLVAWLWAMMLRNRRPLLPPNGEPRALWGVRAVVAVALIVFGTFLLLVVALLPKPAGLPEPSFTAKMLAASLFNVAVLLTLPLVLRTLCRLRPPDVGFSLERFGPNVKAGAMAFLLVTPWVYLVFGMAQLVYHGKRHPLEEMLRQELSPLGIVLAFLSAVVLAPLTEEMIFRGIIQTWLTSVLELGRGWLNRGDPALPVPLVVAPVEGDILTETEIASHSLMEASVGIIPRETAPLHTVQGVPLRPARLNWLPVVLTSLLFAAVHTPEMPAPFAIFVLSLALGFLYQRTGSLVASITLHALFNAFSTLQLLLLVL
jgi:membrane protease YdiL (CAAX protease family)